MKIRLISGLMFNDGRKFGTGLWIIVLATIMVFMAVPRMGLDQWERLILLASILIGGGTIADTWLGKRKPDAPTPPQQG